MSPNLLTGVFVGFVVVLASVGVALVPDRLFLAFMGGFAGAALLVDVGLEWAGVPSGQIRILAALVLGACLSGLVVWRVHVSERAKHDIFS